MLHAGTRLAAPLASSCLARTSPLAASLLSLGATRRFMTRRPPRAPRALVNTSSLRFSSTPPPDKTNEAANAVNAAKSAPNKKEKKKIVGEFVFNKYRKSAQLKQPLRYEKPRTPYFYEYNYRAVDESQPLQWQLLERARYVAEDTLAFACDVAALRENAVMYKTAHFMKRNFGRLITFLQYVEAKSWVGWVALKHGLKHMAHGLKTLFKDGTWAVKTQAKTYESKYSDTNFLQQRRIKQVKKDFIKFVPFSLFLLIPGGELFLPAWVLIFPNSIPSQFVGEKERIKKFEQLKNQQEDAAEKLLYILPNYMARLIQSPTIPDSMKEEIRSVKAMLQSEDFLPTDLIEFRNLFRRYGQFRHFRTRSLIHMAHFMSIEPVTGLNTINNILKLVKTQIPVDAPVIKYMT